jgi:hypothetical protein
MEHATVSFPCRMHSWDIYRLLLEVQTMQQRCVIQAWGTEGTRVAYHSRQVRSIYVRLSNVYHVHG